MLQETNGDTSRDLRLDSDDIADPINDRLTLAERNERLQGQLKSLKDELATTRQVGSQQPRSISHSLAAQYILVSTSAGLAAKL